MGRARTRRNATWRASPLEAADRRNAPFAEPVLLGLRETRFGVHQPVHEWRHAVLAGLFAGPPEPLDRRRLDSRYRRPVGEVEVCTTASDVGDDQPGDWRDTRVPRPVRLGRSRLPVATRSNPTRVRTVWLAPGCSRVARAAWRAVQRRCSRADTCACGSRGSHRSGKAASSGRQSNGLMCSENARSTAIPLDRTPATISATK
jgi:hypothetical protein